MLLLFFYGKGWKSVCAAADGSAERRRRTLRPSSLMSRTDKDAGREGKRRRRSVEAKKWVNVPPTGQVAE